MQCVKSVLVLILWSFMADCRPTSQALILLPYPGNFKLDVMAEAIKKKIYLK